MWVQDFGSASSVFDLLQLQHGEMDLRVLWKGYIQVSHGPPLGIGRCCPFVWREWSVCDGYSERMKSGVVQEGDLHNACEIFRNCGLPEALELSSVVTSARLPACPRSPTTPRRWLWHPAIQREALRMLRSKHELSGQAKFLLWSPSSVPVLICVCKTRWEIKICPFWGDRKETRCFFNHVW